MSQDELRALARMVVEMLRSELVTLPGFAPGLLTKDEIAAVLRVSPGTVDRWTREGMPSEPRGSYKLFDRAQCEAWVAARPKPARPILAPVRQGPPSLRGVELRTRRAR